MRRAWTGLVWYLRAVSGEDRYDRHVAACARDGVPAMSRRQFERHRADQQAHSPSSRCC